MYSYLISHPISVDSPEALHHFGLFSYSQTLQSKFLLKIGRNSLQRNLNLVIKAFFWRFNLTVGTVLSKFIILFIHRISFSGILHHVSVRNYSTFREVRKLHPLLNLSTK